MINLDSLLLIDIISSTQSAICQIAKGLHAVALNMGLSVIQRITESGGRQGDDDEVMEEAVDEAETNGEESSDASSKAISNRET
ncbi:MAG: hypothetical protein Q9157_003844 [Trypethelium eluteriae]